MLNVLSGIIGGQILDKLFAKKAVEPFSASEQSKAMPFFLLGLGAAFVLYRGSK